MSKKTKKNNLWLKTFCIFILSLIIFAFIVFLLPSIFVMTIEYEAKQTYEKTLEPFPITVDPKNKIIIEDEKANVFLQSVNLPIQATVVKPLMNIFELLATSIAKVSWYQNIAAVNGYFVIIKPGMRKEQVANTFSKVLSWNNKEKQKFMDAEDGALLPLPEGSFSPGVYFVGSESDVKTVQTLLNNRFSKEVLSRYGSSTEEIVSLNDALTIASLIQREAGGHHDMRLISGIIWNRIFIDMNLQIDATLQYIKANDTADGSWWPKVVPEDKFRKSVYNTYMHSGLPPNPIANPSVAAIIAALNPIKTSCIYYFHDKNKKIHCSDTYTEHVSLLKKYYGQGK